MNDDKNLRTWVADTVEGGTFYVVAWSGEQPGKILTGFNRVARRKSSPTPKPMSIRVLPQPGNRAPDDADVLFLEGIGYGPAYAEGRTPKGDPLPDSLMAHFRF